ncbi:unnamed protein product, partial [Ectocarpus sp. 12 AP-2014]
IGGRERVAVCALDFINHYKTGKLQTGNATILVELLSQSPTTDLIPNPPCLIGRHLLRCGFVQYRTCRRHAPGRALHTLLSPLVFIYPVSHMSESSQQRVP